MGRKKGELNYWIVPKRCSVYQTLAFLAVLEEYPSYGTWTAANQDNITTKMRINYGALENSTVKNQSARTLKAMVAYMGFIYKEKGRLIITEAGKQFLDRHREKLINKGYFLLKPVSPLLSESEVWKQQMLKLQLTNPDQPKCEQILSEHPVDKMLLPEHDEKKIWRLFYGQAGIHYPNEMVIRNRTLYRIYVNVENCSSGDRKEQELILDGQKNSKR